MVGIKLLISCPLGEYFYAGTDEKGNVCLEGKRSKGILIKEKDFEQEMLKIKEHFAKQKIQICIRPVKVIINEKRG